MKFLLAITFASLISFSIHADESNSSLKQHQASPNWVRVGNATDGSIEKYLDINSVQRTGSRVKVWELTKLAAMDHLEGKSFQSSKGLLSIDCDKRKISFTRADFYSDRDGNGTIVKSVSYSDDGSSYRDIKPGSLFEIEMNYVCKTTPKN